MNKNEPPLFIRQSIVYLFLRLILLQILFTIVYLFMLFPLNFFELNPEIKLLAYSLVSVVFFALLLMQMYFTLNIVLNWFGEYYEVKPGELVFHHGILEKKEKIYLTKHIESITINQSFMEKLFNYGTIRLYNPVLNQHMHIDAVNKPEKYVHIIEKQMSESIPSGEPLQQRSDLIFTHTENV